jgi:hypothetical protein
MKRFRKGGYQVGDLVAVEMIGTILLGTVREFAANRSSCAPPNGELLIKPLRKEAKKSHWVDADAVWSADEIKGREAYLEELERLLKEHEPATIVWELLMQEKAKTERSKPPEDMLQVLEAAEARA